MFFTFPHFCCQISVAMEFDLRKIELDSVKMELDFVATESRKDKCLLLKEKMLPLQYKYLLYG